MEKKNHHHSHQLNGAAVVARSAAANGSSSSIKRRRSSKVSGKVHDLKVVYISTPMKVRTSASKFREIVQELTGKYSDVARIMESSADNGSVLQRDMYWTTADDQVDDHSKQHDQHNQYQYKSNHHHHQPKPDINYYNHEFVPGTTSSPLGQEYPASFISTPTSADQSLTIDYHEPFQLDHIKTGMRSSSSSSSGGAGNDLNYDHFLMIDHEPNLFGSTSFTYQSEFFHGDGRDDQYFRKHDNFELDRNIL